MLNTEAGFEVKPNIGVLTYCSINLNAHGANVGLDSNPV